MIFLQLWPFYKTIYRKKLNLKHWQNNVTKRVHLIAFSRITRSSSTDRFYLIWDSFLGQQWAVSHVFTANMYEKSLKRKEMWISIHQRLNGPHCSVYSSDSSVNIFLWSDDDCWLINVCSSLDQLLWQIRTMLNDEKNKMLTFSQFIRTQNIFLENFRVRLEEVSGQKTTNRRYDGVQGTQG